MKTLALETILVMQSIAFLGVRFTDRDRSVSGPRTVPRDGRLVAFRTAAVRPSAPERGIRVAG